MYQQKLSIPLLTGIISGSFSSKSIHSSGTSLGNRQNDYYLLILDPVLVVFLLEQL